MNARERVLKTFGKLLLNKQIVRPNYTIYLRKSFPVTMRQRKINYRVYRLLCIGDIKLLHFSIGVVLIPS